MADNQQQIYYFSAPGKTIISGEHSVVYYKNALVMAIDLRTYCKLTVSKKSEDNQDAILTIENKQESPHAMQLMKNQLLDILNVVATQKSDEDFFTFSKLFPQVEEKLLIISYLFLTVFVEVCKNKHTSEDKIIKEFNEQVVDKSCIKVEIHSTLPVSKGLGSSASYFTSLSAAFTKMCMQTLSINQLNQDFYSFVNTQAFNFERIYHGTPSGIDNHIATYGNMLLFNKKHTSPIKVNNLPYKILLIDSQVEKSTKKAVARVREIFDDESIGTIGKQTIDMIGQVTDQIIDVINSSQTQFDSKKFENLIRINQSLLRLFDLSHTSIEDIMSICMKYEIAGKITGAGQGGNCIAFVPDHISPEKQTDFMNELEHHGYKIITANLSLDGVREEKL